MRRIYKGLVAAGLLVGIGGVVLAQTGAPVNTPPGSVWTYFGPTYGASWGLPTGILTPQTFGCNGDGVADDTVCLQRAIDGAAASGVPLYFPSNKLYKITNTLEITQPVSLVGPFRYGQWPVNQPTNVLPRKCPWGLVNFATGITLIHASAVTGSIHGLCIDMSGGDENVNPTAGAAISMTPTAADRFIGAWHIEENTILNPFDGVALYGTGVSTACCGIGTASNGPTINNNTIKNPTGVGISIGKNQAATTGGPATVGITATNNSIVCPNTLSKAQGIGVAIYEGALWYDGTQNGPVLCHIGTLVAPGLISGTPQQAQLSADGALGDQSGLHDLLVQPTGGAIHFVSIGGTQPWIAGFQTTSLKIDCTNANTCQNISIANATIHGGGNQALPIVDIIGGASGPFNLSITGSNICNSGYSVGGSPGVALRLNIPAGAATGRWMINSNRIGTGCLGYSVAKGIELTINSAASTHGSVIISNNDLSAVPTPISYTPNVVDQVLIKDNLGLDTQTDSVASATNMTLPGTASKNIAITGTTQIEAILGGWNGRQITVWNLNSPLTIKASATVGSLCGTDLVWAGAFRAAILTYSVPNSCWFHTN